MLTEGAVPAGDLSEEVDEAQSCGAKPPGEEEAYDADSESNPEEMAKQEEGRHTHTPTHTSLCICLRTLGCLLLIGRVFTQSAAFFFHNVFLFFLSFLLFIPLERFFKPVTNVDSFVLMDGKVMLLQFSILTW